MTEYGIRDLKQRVKENKVLTFEERKYINKALTEIQQYRAIGTVESLKGLPAICDLLAESSEKAEKLIEELKAYRAIGTIEELQALKEKNEPKMMDGYYCPICRHYFEDGELHLFCPCCGQALDWE